MFTLQSSKNNPKVQLASKNKFETTYLKVFDVLILMKAMMFSYLNNFITARVMPKKTHFLSEKLHLVLSSELNFDPNFIFKKNIRSSNFDQIAVLFKEAKE